VPNSLWWFFHGNKYLFLFLFLFLFTDTHSHLHTHSHSEPDWWNSNMQHIFKYKINTNKKKTQNKRLKNKNVWCLLSYKTKVSQTVNFFRYKNRSQHDMHKINILCWKLHYLLNRNNYTSLPLSTDTHMRANFCPAWCTSILTHTHSITISYKTHNSHARYTLKDCITQFLESVSSLVAFLWELCPHIVNHEKT
jgi:hypothetical protein